MDLLVTSTGDVTSDLLCEWAGQRVLRVNLERWQEYRFHVTYDGFALEDGYGRRVDAANLGRFIWRKPDDDVDSTDGAYWYGFHEFRYFIRSVAQWLRERRPIDLPVDPFALPTLDKYRQLRVAEGHFPVPAWRATTDPREMEKGAWITKSLTGQPFPGSGLVPKVLFATAVDPQGLEAGWPWFLQARVDAIKDLTVVYVDGRCHGFTLDRRLFKGLDWRPFIGSAETEGCWQPHRLEPDLVASMKAYMAALGLSFGRLDFLLEDESGGGKAWFLEVNPNGQWAWLDLAQTNGLFTDVAQFLFSKKVTWPSPGNAVVDLQPFGCPHAVGTPEEINPADRSEGARRTKS